MEISEVNSTESSSEKQRLELQKEIDEIKYQIKYLKNKNRKLKNLKIASLTGRLIAPYALIAGLAFGSLAINGQTPFYADEETHDLQTMTEMDSLGNVRIEQQYEEFESPKNIISYYSQWKPCENDLYYRDIEVYSADDISEEEIVGWINENNMTNLRDVLGEPILIKNEKNNNLSEEELQSAPFLQAIIFSESEEDFIIGKQSKTDDIIDILVFFVSFGVSSLSIAGIRGLTDFNYFENIKGIKRWYSDDIEINDLQKKLVLKTEQYNRMRKQ